ncbi:MAG: lasso peptide biosynthesis PqqD family chaperone [Candidatus Riflebacteria bacterium]|nr:lasso peptide biosynthesis PqqD family chaperone [Candidatus Riflebacteria bacterium]
MDSDNIINLDTVVARAGESVFSQVDGEVVMMSIENGEYYGINLIGSRIWGLLESPVRVSDVCDILLPDYDVTREQCTKDILLFLQQMVEKGNITIVNAK